MKNSAILLMVMLIFFVRNGAAKELEVDFEKKHDFVCHLQSAANIKSIQGSLRSAVQHNKAKLSLAIEDMNEANYQKLDDLLMPFAGQISHLSIFPDQSNPTVTAGKIAELGIVGYLSSLSIDYDLCGEAGISSFDVKTRQFNGFKFEWTKPFPASLQKGSAQFHRGTILATFYVEKNETDRLQREFNLLYREAFVAIKAQQFQHANASFPPVVDFQHAIMCSFDAISLYSETVERVNLAQHATCSRNLAILFSATFDIEASSFFYLLTSFYCLQLEDRTGAEECIKNAHKTEVKELTVPELRLKIRTAVPSTPDVEKDPYELASRFLKLSDTLILRNYPIPGEKSMYLACKYFLRSNCAEHASFCLENLKPMRARRDEGSSRRS